MLFSMFPTDVPTSGKGMSLTKAFGISCHVVWRVLRLYLNRIGADPDNLDCFVLVVIGQVNKSLCEHCRAVVSGHRQCEVTSPMMTSSAAHLSSASQTGNART